MNLAASASEAAGGGKYEKWLTAEEACEALAEYGIPAIKPKTLGERARTKKVPSQKIMGKRRYRLSALLAHFDASR